VHGAIADSAGGAWTFGGSILTFAFPMILFSVVAVALYVVYTKPEYIPGHRAPGLERPVSYTAVPGPSASGTPAAPAAAPTGPAAGRAGAPVTGTAESAGTTTAETKDAE
jgi:hypothetical protein